MSVYLITGVSGYLGGRILESLSKKPGVDRIIGVDIVEPPVKPDILDFHQMDVRDDALRDLAVKEKVEVFIHLAFVLNPIFNLVKMYSIDVWGTDNALRATAACKAKQLFVTSSASAYGALPDNPEPLLEDHPLRAPKSYQYAYDKAKIDRMCRRFMAEHKEVATTVVRPCIVLGPNVDNYISRSITRAKMFIGGENPTMQFVHEDDVARACLMCIEKKANGVYNLVGEGAMTLEEVWQAIGGRVPPLSLPAWVVYPLVDFIWQMGLKLMEAPSAQLEFVRWPWWYSGDKITKEVGFEPLYSSKEALKSFLDALEERG